MRRTLPYAAVTNGEHNPAMAGQMGVFQQPARTFKKKAGPLGRLFLCNFLVFAEHMHCYNFQQALMP
jgi:hypothetical protein